MKFIDFSKYDFNKDVVVVSDNMLNSDKWRVQWSTSEHVSLEFANVKLGDTLLNDYPEIVEFAKILTYYSFPKKVNLDITSWNTTCSYHFSILNFIKSFFWENQILSKTMISSITELQLQKHLNNIVNKLELNLQGSRTQYSSFVRMIEFWSSLTELKLLPECFYLNVDVDSILTVSLRTKAFHIIQKISNTWKPLNANTISILYNEAYKYLYDYSNTIITCHQLLNNRPSTPTNPSNNAKGALYSVRKDGKTKVLFETLLHMKVPMIGNDTRLFNFKATTNQVKSLGYKCGWQDRTTINITEVRPEVINLKRACIFLILLFTGLRRREIAELKAIPTFVKNGQHYLRIVRFKTSSDASGVGESDEIPVPPIVVDSIRILINLFKINRNNLNSDYLLVSDRLSIKEYDKIKISTINKDIRQFGLKFTNDSIHPHQLRKTLAWLLISRSEYNIELIRQLFGHKSYGMTLRYILRNELIVESVVALIEHNYTKDLKDAFKTITDGKAVGELSTIIKNRIESQNYKGQVLVTDVESFIHHSVQSGIPIFVSRLPIGAFCIKAGDSTTLPPCMIETNSKSPQIEFCDYVRCSNVLHSEESLSNIRIQLEYYKERIKYLSKDTSKKNYNYYNEIIMEHQDLISRLEKHNILVSSELNYNVSQ